MAPHRAGRHPQRRRALGQKRPPRSLFEQKTETVRPAMVDRESADHEIARLQHGVIVERIERNGHRQPGRTKNHTQQAVNALERRAPAEDVEAFQGFPAPQGGRQSAEAQNVIEMAVCN